MQVAEGVKVRLIYYYFYPAVISAARNGTIPPTRSLLYSFPHPSSTRRVAHPSLITLITSSSCAVCFRFI